MAAGLWKRTVFPSFFLMQCWFEHAGDFVTTHTDGHNSHTITLCKGRVLVIQPGKRTGKEYGVGEIIPHRTKGAMRVTALIDDTEWFCFHTQRAFGPVAPRREIITLAGDAIHTLPRRPGAAILCCLSGEGYLNNTGFGPGRCGVIPPDREVEIEQVKAGAWLHMAAPGP